MAAIGKQTLEFESDIKKLEIEASTLENPDLFKNAIDPIEKLGSYLDTTWGLSKTLYLGNNTLMPTKSYLAIHERARRARAVKFNSPVIYNMALKELDSKRQLSDEETRVAKKFVLEGRLNGLNLTGDKKEILNLTLTKLMNEKAKFKFKNDYSTKRFTYKINDESVVSGFPDNLLKTIAFDPNQPLKGPWTVTLKPNICVPFLEYCPDRDMRWNIWQALVSRGSGYGDKELETSSCVSKYVDKYFSLFLY